MTEIGISNNDKYPHGRKNINDTATIINAGIKWRNIYLFKARFGDGTIVGMKS